MSKKEDKLESFELESDSKHAVVGQSRQLNVKAHDADGNDVDIDVKYSSSNDRIATVDDNGNVTGIAEGSVTITAECEKFFSRLDLDVYSQKMKDVVDGLVNDGCVDGEDYVCVKWKRRGRHYFAVFVQPDEIDSLMSLKVDIDNADQATRMKMLQALMNADVIAYPDPKEFAKNINSKPLMIPIAWSIINKMLMSGVDVAKS